MEKCKSENKFFRTIKVIIGLFVAVAVFSILVLIIRYLVNTAGGILLIMMGINIADEAADPTFIETLESIAVFTALVGGIAGGVKSYQKIIKSTKEKVMDEKTINSRNLWRAFVAFLVGLTLFVVTVQIFMVSTLVLHLFGIDAWANFAENNIQVFKAIAGVIGVIVGVLGGKKLYKRKKENIEAEKTTESGLLS